MKVEKSYGHGDGYGQASAMILYGKTQMVDHEELFYDFDNHW